ncbi:30S ribosomal protein S2 [Rickettsia canadensis str. McKiel]|uniref:Small ribosomal subunit protein uS2 n=2 Tax=Rickettsia canadensis TaxID=788 RepID=RS2_RICCK|nr:30S ribosomal protein S2 [Rickettsia canadensis]A8EXF0.1 RecName: Full=Small ribosomal subunit protein uS2; AltName: Full=30S ribosomal protein S2 [Rickettsia canadensis str. McKiel]ABV73033.1 30S ribosomal protein S2 [Rickettsia canadensis str. McKiel]AFB20659.1 30S ribosomal protein S2 [Rickettsia canadensis str. CA410]
MSKIPSVNIKELLDAGVHFGHKTSRWNPKMGSYIYGERDDVHIIDLRQSAVLMSVALNAIYETVKKDGKILFVSTKIQASDIIAEYAEKCGQYYVNHRWLGGMLTNWKTIAGSIEKLNKLEKTLGNEEALMGYTKKEILDMSRKKDKLLLSLAGIRNLNSKPDLLVVIDTNKEHIAINEAVKLNVPIVAVVDTNSNPDNVDYPIPGNDDSIRSIRLYCSLFADAALQGLAESMKASGVDMGAIQEHTDKALTSKSVSKLKQTKKFSKMKNIDEETNTEFEQALNDADKNKNSENA